MKECLEGCDIWDKRRPLGPDGGDRMNSKPRSKLTVRVMGEARQAGS